MEKPDSEGYVNVLWPSRNIPHGGIFHTRTADPTTNQQQLLKVLLEESKFDLKLRRSRAFGLRGGDEGQKPRVATTREPVSPPIRPRTSRRRSLSAIRSSGVLDIDTYRPVKRGEDRDRMKERLANVMAFGDAEQAPPVAPRLKKPAPKIPTTKEKWNELVTQIRERAEWLAEMEWLGEAEPHRDIVEEQIAERMRALDALGVDSVCSSVRSSARSTARSTARSSAGGDHAPPKPEPRADVPSSTSPKGKEAKKSIKTASGRRKKPEENVMAYSQLSPLGYSPRRRV